LDCNAFNASADDLIKFYRRAAMQSHTDKFPKEMKSIAEETFQKVTAAKDRVEKFLANSDRVEARVAA
jgi:DnaJ-class molecular chaperone